MNKFNEFDQEYRRFRKDLLVWAIEVATMNFAFEHEEREEYEHHDKEVWYDKSCRPLLSKMRFESVNHDVKTTENNNCS